MTKTISFYQLPERLAYCLIITMLLAGCENGNFVKAENPQVAANPDKVSAMLAESADRASRSLEQLAAIEQKRTPDASVAPISDAPRELQRAVTINWVGPAETISRKMANRASYDFRVLGEKPPAPIVVSLDKDNARLIDILRDIGLQIGARADIKVDAQTQTVELQYTARSQNNSQGTAAMAPTTSAIRQQADRQTEQRNKSSGNNK